MVNAPERLIFRSSPSYGDREADRRAPDLSVQAEQARLRAGVGAGTVSKAGDRVCLWCGKGFTPRRDGGKRQVFCGPTCRRAFDAAGRRWVAEAIAAGMLTVDALRNGAATTRALLPGGNSPAPVDEP